MRVLLGCCLTLWAATASATPYVPANDDVVVEQVQVVADPSEVAWAANPGDLALAVRVARLNITRGQRLADPRYFGRAEAVLAPWTGKPNPPADIRLLRGILLQNNHAFDAALEDLDAVLDTAPRNGQARLTRAVIRVVRADYAGASSDCAQLVGAAPPGTQEVCVASVAGMTGHARPSLAMLGFVATQSDISPPIRLWAWTLKGEIAARMGDYPAAFAAFEQARAIAPDDAYLLGAYADALIDAGQAAKVAALLTNYARADILLLRLCEAAQQLGTLDGAQANDLAERFETSRRRGDTIHQREEARFTLHVLAQPAEALRLAQANWRVQREPADARILLEAALAAHAPQAASAVLDWQRGNGFEDVRLSALAARLAAGGP